MEVKIKINIKVGSDKITILCSPWKYFDDTLGSSELNVDDLNPPNRNISMEKNEAPRMMKLINLKNEVLIFLAYIMKDGSRIIG